MYGALDYACMLKCVPVSLAAYRSLPKTRLVAILLLFDLICFYAGYFLGNFVDDVWLL